MTKTFLVTGNWVDKVSGRPVSGIAEVNKGINKNGQPYEIAATDSREAPIEGAYPVGTILTAAINLSVQESTNKAPLNLKTSN